MTVLEIVGGILLIVSGLILMTLLNTGVAAPVLGCVLFPILVWLKSKALVDTLLAAIASVLIFAMHEHWILLNDTFLHL